MVISVGQADFYFFKVRFQTWFKKKKIIYLCKNLKYKINYVILLKILAIILRFIFFLMKAFCLHMCLGAKKMGRGVHCLL